MSTKIDNKVIECQVVHAELDLSPADHFPTVHDNILPRTTAIISEVEFIPLGMRQKLQIVNI